MSTADAVLDQPGGLQGFAQQTGFLLQQQQQQPGQAQPQQLQQQQQVAAVNANAVPGLPSIRSSCENFAKAMSTMVLLHEQNTELRNSLSRLHSLYQSETTRLTQHTKQLESLVQQLQAQRDGARRESRELQTFIQKMQPEIEHLRKKANALHPGIGDGFPMPSTSLLEARASSTHLDKAPTTPDQTPTALAVLAAGGGGDPADPSKQLVPANPAGVPPQGLGSLKQLYLNFPMSSLEPALAVCRTASTRILQMFETLSVRKAREGSLMCHFCDHAFDDPLLFFIHQIFPAHVLRSDLAETFSTTNTIKRVYPLERNELQAVAESMSLFKKISSGNKNPPLVCDCCARQTDDPQTFIAHARSQDHLTTVVATIANLYNQEDNPEGVKFLRCILDLGLLLVQATELMAHMRQGVHLNNHAQAQSQEQQSVTAAHMKVCRQYDEACCEVLAQSNFNPSDYAPRVPPEEAMRLLTPRLTLAAGPGRGPATPAPDAAPSPAQPGAAPAAAAGEQGQPAAAAAAVEGEAAAGESPAAAAAAPAAESSEAAAGAATPKAAAGGDAAEAAAGSERAAADVGDAAVPAVPAAVGEGPQSQQATPASTPKAGDAAAVQQPGTPVSQAPPGTPFASAAAGDQAPQQLQQQQAAAAAAPAAAAAAAPTLADGGASPKDPLRAMLSAAVLQPSGAAAPGPTLTQGPPAPQGAPDGGPAPAGPDDGMRPLDITTAFAPPASAAINPAVAAATAAAPVGRYAPSQVLQAGLNPNMGAAVQRPTAVPASAAMMQMHGGALQDLGQPQQHQQLQPQHQQQAAQGLSTTGAQALNDLVRGTMHNPSPLSIFGQQGGGYGQGGQLQALQQQQAAQQQQQQQQQQAQQQQQQQHHHHPQQPQQYSMAQLLAASKAMDIHMASNRDPVVGHMAGLRNPGLGHQGGGGLEHSWLQQQQAAVAAQQQQQQQQAFQQQQQQQQAQQQQRHLQLLQQQQAAQQQLQAQQQAAQHAQQQQQQALLGMQRASAMQQPQQLLQPANPQLQQLVQGGGAQQLLQPSDLNQLGQQQRNQALYGWPGGVLPSPFGN